MHPFSVWDGGEKIHHFHLPHNQGLGVEGSEHPSHAWLLLSGPAVAKSESAPRDPAAAVGNRTAGRDEEQASGLGVSGVPGQARQRNPCPVLGRGSFPVSARRPWARDKGCTTLTSPKGSVARDPSFVLPRSLSLKSPLHIRSWLSGPSLT